MRLHWRRRNVASLTRWHRVQRIVEFVMAAIMAADALTAGSCDRIG